MSAPPTDSMIYLADLRVARLTVVSSLTIPGGGDGGDLDELVNADVSGAGVFKSTASRTATLRRLTSATDSLTVVEGTDVITFTITRAEIGTGASAHSTSVALGPSAIASGEDSIALGRGAATNSLPGATVLGAGASASSTGFYAAVLGPGASVSGHGGAALGYLASASGARSAALGPVAQATAAFSTAVGAGARARVAGTINFGGIPIVRPASDTPISAPSGTPALSATAIRSAPLVALTTRSWTANAFPFDDGGVIIEIPSGAIFFPETLRVWCDTISGLGFSGSSSITISVGTGTSGPSASDIVSAMPVGLIDGPWASRVGAIAATKGVSGTLNFTQGGTGTFNLRCAIQGLLVEIPSS